MTTPLHEMNYLYETTFVTLNFNKALQNLMLITSGL